ncbi:MAG: hypothetical protein HYU69_11210 [Bacteroidetes bacterium]|nr:hypothetical protein [Bacteroidota bacterium]
MDPFIELLKIIIPALIVFLTSFYLLKNFLDNEIRKKMMELKGANKELLTPIRLQAYERVVLFLERISPNSLVMRVNRPTLSSKQLHVELVAAVRTEFEHNLSQQIYMSTGAWDMVKNAKEEITKLINLVAMKVPENTPGGELAQLIVDSASKLNKLPTTLAIEYIKKEIGQTF